VTLAQDFEIVERGLSHRAGPFHVSTVEAVLRPLLEEVQALEDAAQALLSELFLDNATGPRLAFLGARVGEDPLDDTEDDFRLRIRLKIRASRSSGQWRDFTDLLVLVDPVLTWALFEIPAWISVTLATGSVPFDAGRLHRILSYASSGGSFVRLIAPADSEDAEDLLYFPSTDGAIAGTNWPSTDGAVSGANWAAAWSDIV